jgi:transcriptional regulator with XRE-family HTH domain
MEEVQYMNRIREYRRELGLTQAQIAEKLKIRASAVSQWETEVRSPKVINLKRLAEIFGCTVDDLLKPGDAMNDYM